MATLIATGNPLRDPERSPDTPLATLLEALDASILREAVAICTARHRVEERGEIDALRARSPGLRRYLPAFYAWPFQGAPGSEALLAGLDVVRQWEAGTLTPLPHQAPTACIPGKFRPALHSADGPLDRRTGALGVAVAVRDGLRSGDVCLPESRRHVSFTHLVYAPTRWQHARDDASTDLQLPQEPDDFCVRLQRACDEGAPQAERGLPSHACATIRDHRLHLKRRAALELPPRLKPLRHPSEGALPRVRIEDLLRPVDTWCDFTRAFRHPGERAPQVPNFCTTLLATLIAHGTNGGMATMAHSVEEGITADMLQAMAQGCLREDTRKAAHAILANFHHRLPLSAVWGDGTVSSSDGQRFGLQASSLLGSLSPRSFGYDDQALTG